MAIVVGALDSRKIGPRSHVWAEKELIESAAYEFAEAKNHTAYEGEKVYYSMQ